MTVPYSDRSNSSGDQHYHVASCHCRRYSSCYTGMGFSTACDTCLIVANFQQFIVESLDLHCSKF